jgi:hypothetical protein
MTEMIFGLIFAALILLPTVLGYLQRGHARFR